MVERLLNTEDVLDRVGFGRTWLEDRIAEGTFPKPIYKWRRNKWREKDVEDWIIEHFVAHPEGQPTPEGSHAAH